jgi:hypothetical protein
MKDSLLHNIGWLWIAINNPIQNLNIKSVLVSVDGVYAGQSISVLLFLTMMTHFPIFSFKSLHCTGGRGTG